MIKVFDEGMKYENNKPMPWQCLVTPSNKSKVAEWMSVHYHEYFELLYADQGNFRVYIDGKTVEMPEGTLVIVYPRETHSVKSISENCIHTCIKFLPSILFSSEQTVMELEYTIPYVFENFGIKRSFEKELVKASPIIKSLEEIKQENKSKQYGYELAVRAEILKIFSWILRYWYNSSEEELYVPNMKELLIIRKAKKYIDENFTDATLELCAKECGLSYCYFSRLFNQCVGMSFKDYVNLVRINKSVKLLLDKELSITDVAMVSGFSSSSYYIHIFKKLKNVSPNKFRSMILSNSNK